jgi:flagellar biosynthesis protein FliQ
MLVKEFRECGLYAAIALLCQIHLLGDPLGLPLIPYFRQGRTAGIPVLSGPVWSFTLVAIVVGLVLGLHQTIWESWHQTTLFLMHRPMPRRQIYLSKLLAGSLLIIGITAPPLLVYCLWAALPGTHASPFYWSFSEPFWRGIVVAIIFYLGAFLAGHRPASWIGSKLLPLIAVGSVSSLLCLPQAQLWIVYSVLPALIVGLIVSILDLASAREYP